MEEFKNKLLEEKERIEGELSEFATKDPNVKGDWDAKFPSYGDTTSSQEENADEVEEYITDVSMEQTLELRLKDIDEALEKIEKGKYGKCEECGTDINPERLKVNPEARMCMNCAK